MIQVASLPPSVERGICACSFFIRTCTSSQIDLTWRGLPPVHTTKKSVYAQTGRMSRMTTSRASFSWASAAIRRACSMGLKRPELYRDSSPIQRFRADQLGDRGRQVARRAVACREAAAELARGNGRGLDLEERDTTGRLELA